MVKEAVGTSLIRENRSRQARVASTSTRAFSGPTTAQLDALASKLVIACGISCTFLGTLPSWFGMCPLLVV